MTNKPADLELAAQRVHDARATLAADWRVTLERLQPSRLREEATEAASHRIVEARAAIVRSATRNPLILLGLAVLAGVLLYRPVRALVPRVIEHLHSMETQAWTWIKATIARRR